MKVKGIAFCAAATLLSGCQQGPTEEQMAKQGLEPLSGSEIRQVMVGNTAYETGTSNGTAWEWAGYYKEGGKALGRAWWNGGQNEGRGTWRIEGNLWCTEWGPQEWGNGGENCQKLYKDGKTLRYVVMDGPGDNGTATIKRGNPHDL